MMTITILEDDILMPTSNLLWLEIIPKLIPLVAPGTVMRKDISAASLLRLPWLWWRGALDRAEPSGD